MKVLQEGIDVSRYQGDVDWAAVRRAGKQFALVRLGSSNRSGPYVDPRFAQNVKGAQAAGLQVGAYYYTYAQNKEKARRETEIFLKALEGCRLEYPVYLDVEDDTLAALGRQRLTELVLFSLQALDKAGWLPGCYSYSGFLRRYLDLEQLADVPLWVADYRGSVAYPSQYGIWQYSSVGRVDGVSGSVDLNYSFQDYLPRIRREGRNGYPAQAPGGEEVETGTPEQTEQEK